MKRNMIIRKVYLLVTLILASTGNAFSTIHSGSCGENATYILDQGILTITGTGDMYDFDRPTSPPWYDLRDYIDTIIIEEGITRIGNRAFAYIYCLRNLTIPQSVTSIGQSAFTGCEYLPKVSLPQNLTEIGGWAFNECKRLTNVDLPASLTKIGRLAFSMTGVKEIHIPEGVKELEEELFSSCRSLQRVTLPEGLKSIGRACFRDCSRLTSISIPESVTRIDGYAFGRCSSLTSANIPDAVTEVGEMAFQGCPLPKPLFNKHVFISLPTPYTGIYAVPENIEKIAGGAFVGCGSLTSLCLPSQLKSIGESAFENNLDLKTIIWEPEDLEYTFPEGMNIRELIIADNVKNLHANFRYLDKLETVRSYAATPPVLGPNAFGKTDAVLYLSDSCIDRYQANDEWRTTFNIQNSSPKRTELYRRLTAIYEKAIKEEVILGNGFGDFKEMEGSTFLDIVNRAKDIMDCFNQYSDDMIQIITRELEEAYHYAMLTRYTIEDGTEIEFNEQKTYEYLVYTRRFTTTQWESLYVPFAMDYEDWKDDFEVAEPFLPQYHGGFPATNNSPYLTDFRIVNSGSLKPNYPYLIRSKRESGVTGINKSFCLQNVTVMPTVCEPVRFVFENKETFTYTGTYTSIPNKEMREKKRCEVVDFKFPSTCPPLDYVGYIKVQDEGSSDLPPMRWYLNASSNLNSHISYEIFGIRISGSYVSVDAPQETVIPKAPIYDLQGRQLRQKPSKGMYIQGGKKVLVK